MNSNNYFFSLLHSETLHCFNSMHFLIYSYRNDLIGFALAGFQGLPGHREQYNTKAYTLSMSLMVERLFCSVTLDP
jgi:hypothetical protein